MLKNIITEPRLAIHVDNLAMLNKVCSSNIVWQPENLVSFIDKSIPYLVQTKIIVFYPITV